MRNRDNLIRCRWVDLEKPEYVAYHDLEWGIPVHDDRLLFEFLVLEGAQAGLSWLTVLRKRENYRTAFDGFDPDKIAGYGQDKTSSLLADSGIIRNRLKVASVITNAQSFLALQQEYGSFDNYVWRFVAGQPKVNNFRSLDDYPAKTEESDALSKDLRLRGFKFVGSTICYAYMQATGMVNDHTLDCFRRPEIISQYA